MNLINKTSGREGTRHSGRRSMAKSAERRGQLFGNRLGDQISELMTNKRALDKSLTNVTIAADSPITSAKPTATATTGATIALIEISSKRGAHPVGTGAYDHSQDRQQKRRDEFYRLHQYGAHQRCGAAAQSRREQSALELRSSSPLNTAKSRHHSDHDDSRNQYRAGPQRILKQQQQHHHHHHYNHVRKQLHVYDLTRALDKERTSFRAHRTIALFSLAWIVLLTQSPTGTMINLSAAQSPMETTGNDSVAGLRHSASVDLINQTDSWRRDPPSMRELRYAHVDDDLMTNMSRVFEVIFKKTPYSKYWTVEQKWDDLFRRLMSVEGSLRQMMMKKFLSEAEYYADISISSQCQKDLKYIQNIAGKTLNMRWLTHMLDSMGKSEPGMLTGMLANLGHPIQCIHVRAPARLANYTFSERFFELQTEVLGERFRGKYCLASIRPVLPKKPRLVSRFTEMMDASLLSNISYTGDSSHELKMRARQMSVPAREHSFIDREHLRLDQVPFESELYQYLIMQRNFMFAMPHFLGVCYPSSCTREDIRQSLQKTFDNQHQVVDLEFECEQEEKSAWDFFITQRVVAYVLVGLIGSIVFGASLARYILLSKMRVNRSKLAPGSKMAVSLKALDMISMDKCAGILFVKTKRASPFVDWTKVENNRSTAIDSLRGFLILVLIYSQLTVLGCLPVPFMWSKWADSMFPFYRSLLTQIFINMSIWSEAFYIISAYLIGLKCLENMRPKIEEICTSSPGANGCLPHSPSVGRVGALRIPNFFSFATKRYIRLTLPMVAFILLNYVWPRLSNGFVFYDQANKLMKSCDNYGWTNMMLFHNHYGLNETCLWPSHTSASFFQLHLLSYPLIAMCLLTLYVQTGDYDDEGKLIRRRQIAAKLLSYATFGTMALLAVLGAVYSGYQAAHNELIVPLLIDYIDFDNYQRVLEWMVLPTYNHLTSYMFGLALAFIVVRRKARNELALLEASDWFGQSAADTRSKGSGSPSVLSSSTQELHEGLTFKSSSLHGAKFQLNSGQSSMSGSSRRSNHDEDGDSEEDERRDASLSPKSHSNSLWRKSCSLLSFVLMTTTLLSSWFWNGLGQPMSAEQTFWFVVLTKLLFCAAFAYLFHQHFATRRNSSNPWMLTRFLVPIGRMSLTAFYMSWLVIWFDLLASLYQWHPSHYFIFEKFNEIIFITLVVGVFVYGAFEGIYKRIQYMSRAERVKHDIMKPMDQPDPDRACRLRVKAFESFFEPLDEPETGMSDDKRQLTGDGKTNVPTIVVSGGKRPGINQTDYGKSFGARTLGRTGESAATFTTNQQRGESDLSPNDRYQLNAELRANYSFASIGLYENAGATGDLSALRSGDPQPSPAMSESRR